MRTVTTGSGPERSDAYPSYGEHSIILQLRCLATSDGEE